MTSPDADLLADRPQPLLPVIVRPQQDETVNAYVRRLAQANHLRPSHLRQYLCAPSGYQGSVRAARLAAVTNRTVEALTRNFPALQVETPHPRPGRPSASSGRTRLPAPKHALTHWSRPAGGLRGTS